LARNLTFTEHSRKGSEVLKIKKVSISDLDKMVESGEINDALSLIAITRAKDVL